MVQRLLVVAFACATVVSAACIPTTFERDGHFLTAAMVNPATVSGDVDATGCDMGIYYDSAPGGTILGATIHDATYFGVVVNGDTANISVSILNSHITKIGDHPSFTGSQHGVGIYYRALGTGTASGTISGNTVDEYQKGGTVIVGAAATAFVTNNVVTGLGPVSFIAQNGVQVSYGATGDVSGNTITGNAYTGCSNQDAAKTGCTAWVSAGLLLYDVDANSVGKSNHAITNAICSF